MNRNFICIKQFRPPLRFGASSLTVNTIPAEQLGFWFVMRSSYELCAGLMDIEGRSKEQTVVDEIREELGYDVSVDSLEFITRSNLSLV